MIYKARAVRIQVSPFLVNNRPSGRVMKRQPYYTQNVASKDIEGSTPS
jgi:hypothetical protein